MGKTKGCILHNQPLGIDYANAKERCDEVLKPQFDAWRKKEEIVTPSTKHVHGTFHWMVEVYKSSPQYQRLLPKTHKDYDSALHLVSEYTLKNGRSFGTLDLKSISPGAADRLFEQLKNVLVGQSVFAPPFYVSRSANVLGT